MVIANKHKYKREREREREGTAGRHEDTNLSDGESQCTWIEYSCGSVGIRLASELEALVPLDAVVVNLASVRKRIRNGKITFWIDNRAS